MTSYLVQYRWRDDDWYDTAYDGETFDEVKYYMDSMYKHDNYRLCDLRIVKRVSHDEVVSEILKARNQR